MKVHGAVFRIIWGVDALKSGTDFFYTFCKYNIENRQFCATDYEEKRLYALTVCANKRLFALTTFIHLKSPPLDFRYIVHIEKKIHSIFEGPAQLILYFYFSIRLFCINFDQFWSPPKKELKSHPRYWSFHGSVIANNPYLNYRYKYPICAHGMCK